MGVLRVTVGGHPSLVAEYSRTGPKGPVLVQITSLYLDGKEMRLTLSYRESEAGLWKPIVAYIGQSLSVAGDGTRGSGGPAQTRYDPPAADDAPTERLMEELFGIAFGVLTISLATWPAIILNRKMLAKSPRRRPFAWGYFLALAVLLLGIVSLGLAFTDSDERALLIASGVTASLLAALLCRRNRWAWLAFVILQLNPLSWIVNGIYLKNRWGEMRDDA